MVQGSVLVVGQVSDCADSGGYCDGLCFCFRVNLVGVVYFYTNASCVFPIYDLNCTYTQCLQTTRRTR